MGVMSNEDLISGVEETPASDDTGVPAEVVDGTEEDDTVIEASQDVGDEVSNDTETLDGEGDETVSPEPDAADSETNQPETYTLKVNGEEIEVSLEDLKRGFGTTKAANQKFEEAASQRKQAEDFINMLKTNPMAVLGDPAIGLDARAVAEQYLAEQIRVESMTPEQKELYDAKQALANFEQERKATEQQQHEIQMTALTEQYEAEYQQRIKTALGDANLPVTEQTTQRMAGYMYQVLNAEDAATQNLSDTDLVELVRQDYIKDFQHLFGETDADTLVNILGKDVAKKLRAADVARVKGGAKPAAPKPAKKKKDESKPMTNAEFDAYLDALE